MQIKNRQQMLIVVAVAIVGLFAADKIVFTPLGHFWSARSDELGKLRKDVAAGKQLINREQGLRGHWAQMNSNTLPASPAMAEQKVFKAFEKWSQDSRLSVTSIMPQWKRDSDEYSTLQCRVEAAGDLTAVTKFLYDLEKDPMALRLENLEISSRDNEGMQLALGLQVSGLVLTQNQPQTR
jgi:Tfp pilus assembly protein PilO